MDRDLAQIIGLLEDRTGHDFSGYKEGTLHRRIARRLALHQLETLGAYRELLESDPEEVETLADELLIGVTSFFRESESWRALEQDVLPDLFADKAEGEAVRAWVAGCASGEEAYTLAMVLDDYRDEHHPQTRLQIFATDVDVEAIATARAAVYPAAAVEQVPEAMRERYFQAQGDRFRIRQELRETVVFAPQDLTSDPPFSNMDLVLCRNVMIYLKADRQRQIYRLLHFALRPGGYLMLGTSESVSQDSTLFSPVSKRQRIYRSRQGDRRFLDPSLQPSDVFRSVTRGRSQEGEGSLEERAVSLLMDRYTPASVLVDENHRVCYFHGDTSPYLAQTGGEPTADLLELARPGLASVLLAALHRAGRSGERVEIQSAMVEMPRDPGAAEGGAKTAPRPIRATIEPVPGDDDEAPLFLVSFRPAPTPEETEGTPTAGAPAMVQGLEDELRSAREELRATVQQLKVANEELRAANEESMSMNEELRSTNEELEASKEELQAMNEELRSVNGQLEDNVEELETTNADLNNLLRSTDVATVFLDEGLQVRRFTPPATRLFKVIESDAGRPLDDLVWRFEDDRLEADARAVLKEGKRRAREIVNDDGCWFIRRILPYHRGEYGPDEDVDGVVLTFSEVTRLKDAQEALRLNEERFRVTLKGSPVVVWQQDTDLRYTWVHNSQVTVAEEMVGKRDEDLLTPKEAAFLTPIKRRVLESGEGVRQEFAVGMADGQRTYDLAMEPLRDAEGRVVGLTGAGIDITDRIEIEAALRASESQLREQARYLEDMELHRDEFLAMLAHELRNPMYPIRSAVELIAQDAEGTPSRRMAWAVDVVRRQVRQMTRLVDDLVDMARITRDQIVLRKTEMELMPVVEQAVETVAELIDKRNHRLILDLPDDPVTLVADGSRLAQVIASLLSNAAKFTEPGGLIELTGREDDGHLVLRVRDNGEGIPETLLPKVFELFRQGKRPLDRSKGGLGLGLTLVRRLVELHDGTVEAASDGPGTGSTFTVRLPLEPPETPRDLDAPAASCDDPDGEEKPKTRAPVRRAPRMVLVVDDNPDAADAMSMLLELEGYQTTTALDGPSAVEKAREVRPDVIFLDIGLPEMDGFEVAEAIRRELGNDILLVALTGYGQEKDRRRSEEAGFNHHLLKPASLEQIREVLSGELEG